MKKKVLSLILAGTMTLGLALTGCSGGSDDGGSDSDGGSTAAEDTGSDEGGSGDGDKPYAGITLKWWAGNAENNPGTQAVMEAATEKLGMEFEVESTPAVPRATTSSKPGWHPATFRILWLTTPVPSCMT